MARNGTNREPEAKGSRKRDAKAASLDDCTRSPTDVSDQDDSEGTGRNGDYNAKTIEIEKSNDENSRNNDGESNGESETLSRTKDIILSGINNRAEQLEGDNKKTHAGSDDDDEQSESSDEDHNPEANSLDRQTSLPRKRRKKPSQKLRMQDEEEEVEEIDNGLPNQSGRRPSKRKASLAGMGTLYKKARLRKFEPEEEKAVLERARKRGLPARWTTAFHKDWNRKVWISPDRSRICDTVPRAILISQKMKFPDKAEDAENGDIDEDSEDEGSGEEVEEDSTKVPGSFVTLKKDSTPSGNDPASLFIASSPELHELSVDQEITALRKGRAKGLRKDGWRCVWNSRFRRKNWVSPQGKIFGNLSRAIEKQDDWILKEEKRKLKENRKIQEVEREWQKQFKRLNKYKRKHGDTQVPDNVERYAQLRIWARRQRRQYLRAQKGETASITPAHIEALNQIGFQWEVEKVPKGSAKSKTAITFAAPKQAKASSRQAPPDGSIFDNAPEELFTRRHVLFSDMQPPLVPPARVPIKFVNPVKKLPNGNLGTESYCREVEQYLQTWYGIGQSS